MCFFSQVIVKLLGVENSYRRLSRVFFSLIFLKLFFMCEDFTICNTLAVLTFVSISLCPHQCQVNVVTSHWCGLAWRGCQRSITVCVAPTSLVPSRCQSSRVNSLIRMFVRSGHSFITDYYRCWSTVKSLYDFCFSLTHTPVYTPFLIGLSRIFDECMNSLWLWTAILVHALKAASEFPTTGNEQRPRL